MIDLHTHKLPPQPEAIICLDPLEKDFDEVRRMMEQFPEQAFSVGFHPWQPVPKPADYELLEELARRPNCLLIGEAGIDLARQAEAPFAFRLIELRKHIEISEKLGKPLLLHCVKGDDIILGLKRDLQPTQPWIIHGFRGKPATAEQLMRANIRLSFGPKFNPETLKAVGPERLLSETDDSGLTIDEVLTLQADTLSITPARARETAKNSLAKLL